MQGKRLRHEPLHRWTVNQGGRRGWAEWKLCKCLQWKWTGLGGETWEGGEAKGVRRKRCRQSLKLFKGGEWPSSSSRMNCDRAEVILLEKCSSPRFTLENGCASGDAIFSSPFFFSFFFFFFYFNPPDSVIVNLFSNGGTPVEFWNRNSRLKKYRGCARWCRADCNLIFQKWIADARTFSRKCFLKNANCNVASRKWFINFNLEIK